MRKLAILLLVAIGAMPLAAVTEKEMEEARTIAAKGYLRWTNDGSGYLDEISVKTMADLTAKLKDKEKENLKAFNSVKVPTDYASWDKAKLVEYWGVTFFASPGLDENGKRAKDRVKKQISAMNISAPAPAAETPAPEASEGADAMPDAGAVAAESAKTQEEILSDQQAIAKDAKEAEDAMTPPEQSHTWVYILVLAILVGVVIWLVVYAANLMKRQPGAQEEESDNSEAEELRKHAKNAIAKKNQEIEALQQRLKAEEDKNDALGAELARTRQELERITKERDRDAERYTTLREENARLAEEARRPAPAPAAAAKLAPKKEAPQEKPILKVIYLGRANARGIFVRADRRINAGNTIYRLDTNDGLVGTFHVVDEPEVVEVALSNPGEYLANGCMGEELDDTRGVTRILTETQGTAIFENGYWKVLRKTRIRYE